jgi:hypothetical protein
MIIGVPPPYSRGLAQRTLGVLLRTSVAALTRYPRGRRGLEFFDAS